MGISKKEAKEELKGLVAKFARERASGKIRGYGEEATKIGFIQPLLKDVLGWDVTDIDEVSPEERVSKGRVDYSLKVDGRPIVYIEAKAPKENLRKEHHVRQAINYGYSKGEIYWVLLTDFEEFRLFDISIKPDRRNLEKGLRKDLRYDQYIERFEDLWLLSKESVCSGELDKLLLKKPTKEHLPVSKDILEEDLKMWREALAKNIYKNNPDKFHTGDSEKDAIFLKECTQKILDRIIFMRSCEDRGLTSANELKDLVEGRTKAIMLLLKDRFRYYNITFNSDLFIPHECENLDIDFKVLSDIILETYNPYQFDVIPLEVLGSIYEQYLGYIPRLTNKQVKYELKPEARKAGGVYYTPEYIVDYIVKNTVGRLLKELKPQDAQKIRILDPACGSGSFLIRAYQEMLDYYLGLKRRKGQKRREMERQKHQERLDLKDEPQFRLDIQEKRDILLNHIFGVDIDEQAVEVTKLSLMLKMLEGEGEYGILTSGRSMLPVLDSNIKCGNSLISGSVQELKEYFGDDWYKVKSFDWKYGFKKIIGEGGFDVVIGNPPYVEFKRLDAEIKKPIREKFESSRGKFDLFIPFIEQGIKILKEGGFISYICPSMFTKRDFGEGIRKFITDNGKIVRITYFNDFQVFGKVTNYPLIFFFQKSKKIKNTKIELFTKTKGLTHTIVEKTLQEDKNTPYFKTYRVNSNNFSDEVWDFSTDDRKTLRNRLETLENIKSLGELCKYIFVGIQSGKDEVFYIDSDVISRYKLEREIIFPIFRGEDIGRYFSQWSDTWVIYPYDRETNKPIPERYLNDKYPNVYRYLQSKRNNLRGREYFDKSNKKWYELWCERVYKKFKQPKIIVAEISPENRFYLDTKGFLGNTKTFNLVLRDNQTMDYKYLLGILNSKLMNFYHKLVSVPKAGGYFEYKTQFLSLYPIRSIDFGNPSDAKISNNLIELVDVMLNMNKKIQTAKGSEKEQIQRQIEKTDREIDDLVYKLYGITEEERKIIEGDN